MSRDIKVSNVKVNTKHFENIQTAFNSKKGKLSKATKEKLDEFNSFDLQNHIESWGREQIEKDLLLISALLEKIDLQKIVDESTTHSLQIVGGQKIEYKDVIFVYAGYRNDARTVDTDSCIINLGNLIRDSEDFKLLEKKIRGLVAHESIHVILSSSDILYTQDNSYYDSALERCWEEGLATYIETRHLDRHYEYIKDWKFWLDILVNWGIADNSKKKNLLNHMFENSVFRKYNLDDIGEFKSRISKNEDLEELFMDTFFWANGAGYHLGAKIWEEMVEDSSLQKLVKGGHSQMKEWIKIMKRELL